MLKPKLTAIDEWGRLAPEVDKRRPTQTQIDNGWTFGQRPPYNDMNWLFVQMSQYMIHNNMHGINGWDKYTIYSEGALTHGSNRKIYQATVENSNRDPLAGGVWVEWGGRTADYVKRAGDTLTGALRGIAPVNGADLTRKDYVDSKAPINSPTLTGIPRTVQPPNGDSSNRIATTDFVQNNSAEFVAGTVMLFFQLSAPLGWSQVTTHNDAMLRVVSGAGGGVGGTHTPINLSHNHTTQSHVLTINELPKHSHTTKVRRDRASTQMGNAVYGDEDFYGEEDLPSNDVGGNAAHNHGATALFTIRPKYINVIACRKSTTLAEQE